MLSWLLAVAGAVCPGPEFPPAYVVDADVVDDVPPGLAVLDDVTFSVDSLAGCDGCPPVVVLDLVLGATEDDTTPPESMGYLLRVRDGNLPDEVTLPDEAFTGPVATFRFPAPPEAFDQDVAVQLELRAVDRAGNVSTRALVVDVRATSGAACAHTPRAGFVAPLFAATLLVRRSRPLRHGVARDAAPHGAPPRRA